MIFEIVQAKLTGSGIVEPFISLAINEAEQYIKNYCAIDSIPNALLYTWANIAVDLANYQKTASAPQSVSIDSVGSIRIGDTNVSLGGSKKAEAIAMAGHRVNLDAIAMDYRAELNRFRRMWW